jgi:hypothetical protein
MNLLRFAITHFLAGSLLASATLAQNTTDPAVPPVVIDKGPVGISSRDGISISGADVLVTRNGVTEKLTKEMALSNGTRVGMGGTVTAADGTRFILRDTQLLTFDGKLVDPAKPNASAAPAAAGQAQTTTATTAPAKAAPAAEAPQKPADNAAK